MTTRFCRLRVKMQNRIKAWKKIEEGKLAACELEDPEATKFSISYLVHGAGFFGDVEFDSLYLAQNVLRAMQSAYTTGKHDAFAELRNLIGVKN